MTIMSKMMNKVQKGIKYPRKDKEAYKIRRKRTLVKLKTPLREIQSFKTEQVLDQTS